MKRPWLAPFTPLYAAGVALRDLRVRRGWKPVRHLRWPVISVGNLSTGGAGKTPLAIALARLLAQRGFSVDVLSRGYGRQNQKPARVDPDGTAEQFGDEPLLIAREAGVPVYVAPQRCAAGTLAESDKAPNPNESWPRVHILDDGFQHRQLHRDVDILMLGFDDLNDKLLPAGNLREGLNAARRADVIALPWPAPEIEIRLKALGWRGSIWHVHRRMDIPANDGPVFAFCGIARPEQFFSGLEGRSVQIAVRRAFPDHYRYTDQIVEWLVKQARASGARAFLTTEKDAVRLGPLALAFPPDLPLKTARLTLEIRDQGTALDSLISLIRKAQIHPPL
jgi:tetraacyldisaccharide 4'-kinase